MSSIDQFLKECKDKNPKAQKELFEMYAKRMKFICLRYLSFYDLADDAFQEGFVKVHNNIKTFNDIEHFEAWMTRIFINTSISFLRKLKNTKEDLYDMSDISFGVSETMEVDELVINNHRNQNIDFRMIESIGFTKEELMSCINRLPTDFRVVFNLFIIDGLKHKDIAKLLGIEERTSRSRLARAKNKAQVIVIELCKSKLALAK